MARTAKKSAPRRKRASAATGAPIKRIVKPNGVRDTLREVEQFLFRQADLLDERRWGDFIELFADDGLYWMPASPEQTTGEGVPSIFYEDRNLMTVRMKRVTHPHAWSQSPMWGTSHLVSNVAIEKDDPRTGEITVRSRFHMMEFRRDVSRHFAGTYRHRLAKTKDGYRIKLQRVDMVNGQGPYDYVLQVWV
ncbi:MAG TPA: aromatic-ring-hydroxylating dioxygenase subunit beta [Stellaceae bacterium]|jgi:3-phenylpropionate/cinnamic acid dioxygenase small subunit|nr:aromatic-ring-hydroxylating dioxygenase subunit beta [Stellaceae bacterium]